MVANGPFPLRAKGPPNHHKPRPRPTRMCYNLFIDPLIERLIRKFYVEGKKILDSSDPIIDVDILPNDQTCFTFF